MIKNLKEKNLYLKFFIYLFEKITLYEELINDLKRLTFRIFFLK